MYIVQEALVHLLCPVQHGDGAAGHRDPASLRSGPPAYGGLLGEGDTRCSGKEGIAGNCLSFFLGGFIYLMANDTIFLRSSDP